MNANEFERNTVLALTRVVEDAAIAKDAEDALWAVTRTVPSLMGDSKAANNAGNLPDGVTAQRAAVAFMKTPDGQHHINTAPVNFLPEQYHELIPIDLGHPGHVAQTRRAILLRDTSHHDSFVKILQTFRAGSAMQVPLLWKDEYIGCLICASSVRNSFSEIDLEAMRAFAGLAAALWIAHDGPGWLTSLDYKALPRRTRGS
jgi:GAF domain